MFGRVVSTAVAVALLATSLLSGIAIKAWQQAPVLLSKAMPTISPRELMPVASTIDSEVSAGTTAFRSVMTPFCHRNTGAGSRGARLPDDLALVVNSVTEAFDVPRKCAKVGRHAILPKEGVINAGVQGVRTRCLSPVID